MSCHAIPCHYLPIKCPPLALKHHSMPCHVAAQVTLLSLSRATFSTSARSGGTTMFPGIASRLEMELRTLYLDRQEPFPHVEFWSGLFLGNTCWVGGKLLWRPTFRTFNTVCALCSAEC